MSSEGSLFRVVGFVLALLVGLAVGAMALGPLVQAPKTVSTTVYSTKSFTETMYSTQSIFRTITQTEEITKTIRLTETETQTLTQTSTTTRTITEISISYAPIKVPYEPDTWKDWPLKTILNPDFEYEKGSVGVLPCNDWCGINVIWLPELTENFTDGLGIVNDGTKTVVVMHPLGENQPSILCQPLSINNTKQYILSIRARNIAVCSQSEPGCGDSILVIKLIPEMGKEIRVANILLDTRAGWIERNYDITDLIRKAEYFEERSLAWLVIEAQAGGPRGSWWGEHIAIDYIKLEVK